LLHAHQRIAYRDQILCGQLGGEIQERLSTRRQAQAAMADHIVDRQSASVDHDLGPLREHSAWRQGDVRSERSIDRGAEQFGSRPVTEGCVGRKNARQQQEALALVDRVVQSDGEVMSQSQEAGPPEPAACEPGCPCRGRVEDGWK
jgi:hypothetical protein